MQKEIAALLRPTLAGLVGAVIALTVGSGCGWQKTLSFASPSRTSTVEIWQTRVANQLGTRVELILHGRPIVLYESPGKAILAFVHVTWLADETKVGILGTGDSRFEVAYDLAAGASIPFDTIRKEFAESIATTYRLQREVDPIEWAGSARAHVAFSKLHPEFRPRYLGP